tara:strand:- start:201 stop:653 length:453 start_codon:yes stop_codon:yes gene_type:complete
MERLETKYKHINPNITTAEQYWKPIHNAMYSYITGMGDIDLMMIKKLFKMGSLYRSKIIDNPNFKSNDLFEFLNQLEKYFKDIDLYYYSDQRVCEIYNYLSSKLDTKREYLEHLSEIDPVIDKLHNIILDIYDFIDNNYKFIRDIVIIDN